MLQKKGRMSVSTRATRVSKEDEREGRADDLDTGGIFRSRFKDDVLRSVGEAPAVVVSEKTRYRRVSTRAVHENNDNAHPALASFPIQGTLVGVLYV